MKTTVDEIKKYAMEMQPIDFSLEPAIRAKLNNLTKPIGSLGFLEDIVTKYCLIKNTLNPTLGKKLIVVYVADHGVVEEGVSLYPQEVTKQMIYNFLSGGAGINVLARDTDSILYVIDVGVNGEININHPNFISRKIGYGTKNPLKQKAMTSIDAIKSILAGIEITERLIEKHNPDVIVAGDMGIGNTTTSSAITSVILNVSPQEVTGIGTGINDKMREHKIDVINRMIKFHSPSPKDPIEILSCFGGYEIAAICGTVLSAAKFRKLFIMDGFIVTTGVLVATLFSHRVVDYILAGHCSAELGHIKQLEALGLKPILNLGMRLGEGTGATLAIKILESAIKLYNEMATFDSAGVSKAKE